MIKKLVTAIALASLVHSAQAQTTNTFEAGAAKIDISPATLPALRNGGFLQASSNRIDDPLFARCLVLKEGKQTIAIVIVDSCMFSTTLCDEIKKRAHEKVGIKTDRILISATHTHSAPSAMAYCLGCDVDEPYVKFVPDQIAEAIESAHQALQPAKFGWKVIDGTEFTNCRRWITRLDRMGTDPFGNKTVRAMMHPGHQNPNYVCPAGPIDPDLSILSVVSVKDEMPICIMANLSMHYFGASAGFSADYFGETARGVEAGILKVSGKQNQKFVGIMSQGTSGDLHWMDYRQPRKNVKRHEYAQRIADRVLDAWKEIKHQPNVELGMVEKRLTLKRRLPDRARLEWARPINAARGDLPPRNRVEVYAQQVDWIDKNRTAEVVLQAVQIADFGIAALPNEVYGITGLKLKMQNPFTASMNLELANGGEGYIPPPEQHRLGGYTTWPARSAGLEVQAEPQIVESLLASFEQLSETKRKAISASSSNYSQQVASKKPISYWRLDDLNANQAVDQMGNHPLEFDGPVAMFLPSNSAKGMASADYGSRATYFAGGTISGSVKGISNDYSTVLWIWSGLPFDAREPSAVVAQIGNDRLLVTGKKFGNFQGRLGIQVGSNVVFGKTSLKAKQWHHVVLTRAGKRVRIYLDGKLNPEIDAAIAPTSDFGKIQIGGSGDPDSHFDGKIDEVALFDQALNVEAVKGLYEAAGN